MAKKSQNTNRCIQYPFASDFQVLKVDVGNFHPRYFVAFPSKATLLEKGQSYPLQTLQEILPADLAKLQLEVLHRKSKTNGGILVI